MLRSLFSLDAWLPPGVGEYLRSHLSQQGRFPGRDCSCAGCQGYETDTAPACPGCDDTGWCKADVLYGDPGWARAEPCPLCNGGFTLASRRDRVRAESGIPARLLAEYRFERMLAGKPPRPQAEAWLRDRSRPWLVLSGDTGLGKTMAAVAVANAVMDRAEPAHFAVVPEWLDQLRSAVGRGESLDLIKAPLLNDGLVVLDEIGGNAPTAWSDDTLYGIVNQRYNRALPTVFTTNVRPTDVPEGDRLYSRLFGDLSVKVWLQGPDRRVGVARGA